MGRTPFPRALANHLFTWKTIRDVDEMPVNLIILAEGEEEISSANFIEYIRTHRRELKADAAIANDYSEDLRGVPTIYLGVKGCLYLTIWSRGNPQSGGPMDSEIHSSNAVWIGSPVWRLLQALNTLSTRTNVPRSMESGTTSSRRRRKTRRWSRPSRRGATRTVCSRRSEPRCTS